MESGIPAETPSEHGQRGGDTALSIAHLSKTFPGTQALDDVSFDVVRGNIHALLGGNGSGKSSLIKVIAGIYQGDPGGTIAMPRHVTRAEHTSPTLARHAGLRFVHQNPGLFRTLTVADNIAIGSEYPTQLGRINKRALNERTRILLDRFEIAARPTDVLGTLRPADQTMIAVARALEARDGDVPEVLVLDEPTASLPENEVNILLTALRRAIDAGQTIVYVSHRIDEVLEIANTVTVLRDGRHVVTTPTEGLTEQQLIDYIVGRPLERVFAHMRATQFGSLALEVKHLAGGPLHDVSFQLRRGEILGVAGLLGSGRTELLKMIFGAYDRAGGEIWIDGTRADPATPGDAMRRAVAFVPENREVDAAFSDLTVRENLSIAQLRKYRRLGRVNRRQERKAATDAMEAFSIRASGTEQAFSALSGGNQQKVVLGRWIRRSPEILLLDEPTQGVDVGARADVYASIGKAVQQGMAVILVTSDFEELAQASDRVIVLRGGRVAENVHGDHLTRDTITHLAYRTTQESP